MKFFKPEDFPDTGAYALEAAHRANAKLERDGKVVYGKRNSNGIVEELGERHLEHTDTHKALLICIEPIEVCKHPPEKIKHDLRYLPGWEGFICECGAKVKPVSFEAIG